MLFRISVHTRTNNRARNSLWADSGLVVFVFGSFSMAVPSNGGLGPWNLAVMFALSLYAIDDTRGAAFSMVMWGCQAAMLITLGVFSAVYIALSGATKSQSTSPAG